MTATTQSLEEFDRWLKREFDKIDRLLARFAASPKPSQGDTE